MSVLAGIEGSMRRTNITRYSFTCFADARGRNCLPCLLEAEHLTTYLLVYVCSPLKHGLSLLLLVPRLLQIVGFLGRFSATRSAAWRASVYSLYFSVVETCGGKNAVERKGRNDGRTIRSDEFAYDAAPAQTLPPTRSARSSFILAPSRCCPTMGPLSSSIPTRSPSPLFSRFVMLYGEKWKPNVGEIIARVGPYFFLASLCV